MRLPGTDYRLFIALGCAILFALLAWLVTSGGTLGLDERVLHTLRRAGPLDEAPDWLVGLMRDITSLAGIGLVVLVGVAVLVYQLLQGRWRAALMLVFLLLTTHASVTFFKDFFQRARPDLVEHGAAVHTLSFPSGHSAMAAALCLTIAWTGARLHAPARIKIYFWVVGLGTMGLIGFSRMYLGVHWLSDVLAGWCLGAFWAALCTMLGDVINPLPKAARPRALPTVDELKHPRNRRRAAAAATSASSPSAGSRLPGS